MNDTALSKLLTADIKLPTMPAVAARLLELRGSPSLDVKTLSSLLSQDPAIAATVLRYVNSPAYLMGHTVETIDRAIVVLGSRATMEIALTVSLARGLSELRGDGLDYDLFWRRSLFAATAARVLGRTVREPALEELFVAGLLQDIGLLALDVVQPDLYVGLGVDQHDHCALSRAEQSRLGFDHADFGARLLLQWGLHARTVRAVSLSHSLDRDIDDGFMACVVASGALADFFIHDGNLEAQQFAFQQLYRLFSIRETEGKQILIRMMSEMRNTLDLFAPIVPGQGHARDNVHPLTRERAGSEHAISPAELLASLRANDFLEDEFQPDGVISRAAFENSLKNGFKMLNAQPFSVVLLSINNLRALEQQHGQKVAKLLLRVVGRKLMENIRVEDFVCRYGDCFALILLGSPVDSASRVVQRIVDIFVDARYEITNGDKVALSLNAGIAGHTGSLRFDSHEAMLAAAAAALQEARARGEYRVVGEAPDSQLPGLAVPAGR